MTTRQIRLIGLTGTIASGKSTVLSAFAACGAQTLCADELVRELYQTRPVQRQLEAWFGSSCPKQVAAAVFRSAAARRKLEQWLHPQVWRLAQKKMKAFSKPWAVFEVPLLFEAGWDAYMDLTLVVAGRPQAKWLRARGITRQEYERRLKTQSPVAEKIRRADLVIVNDGSQAALQQKVARMYRALTDFYEK